MAASSPQTSSIFAPAVQYDSGGRGATSVVVADVNGDGKPDLIVANDRAEALFGIKSIDTSATYRAAAPRRNPYSRQPHEFLPSRISAKNLKAWSCIMPPSTLVRYPQRPL